MPGEEPEADRFPERIRLVPLEPEVPPAGLVEWLASKLGRAFGAETVTEPPLSAAPEWRPGGGVQLHSGAIVDSLIACYPQGHRGSTDWVLAITAADLRGGEREFVFGEATLGGAWAVIGTARFGAPGEAGFRMRVLKEALHELGHVAGLDHCADPDCVMAPSRDVAALDRKGQEPCSDCRTRMPLRNLDR